MWVCLSAFGGAQGLLLIPYSTIMSGRDWELQGNVVTGIKPGRFVQSKHLNSLTISLKPTMKELQ